MFSLVQHLLYRVDPMADSYEMKHMVVNTTAQFGTKNGRFEPGGVSSVAILARSKCKTPECILP